MGEGIDLARNDAPIHAAVLDNLKDQLLIVFLKRLGGDVKMHVSEVDDTGGDMLAFSVNPDTKEFHFTIKKKQ